MKRTNILTRKLFQSTLPVRGATRRGRKGTGGEEIFQSTLPVRGATDHLREIVADEAFQSTLPVRGATATLKTHNSPFLFQSTLPVRGATNAEAMAIREEEISIHAPRAGSD